MNAGRNAAASAGAVSKDECFGAASASPSALKRARTPTTR